MRSFLHKGVAACATVLLSVNVMAQDNVFMERTDIKFTPEWYYFIQPNLVVDKDCRLVFPLTEEVEINYGSDGVQTSTVQLGFQVYNKNMEVEKELKMFSVDEALNTRLRVREDYANGSWVSSNDIDSYPLYNLPFFMYYSANRNISSAAAVSQSLFNDDDKFEVIVPVFGGEVVEHQEGSSYRYKYINYVITSFKIVSETGEILYTLNAGSNMFFVAGEGGGEHQIINIGDKTYLILKVGRMDTSNSSWKYGDTYRWYEISKEANSVNLVREVRGGMNILPTIADRDAQITITLDDESNVARELIITGVNGQLVERRAIPAGENTVQVSAAMMRSGMYNFTLQKKGEIVDNGKVIVK